MNVKHLMPAMLIALATLSGAAMAEKKTICHIPPGNPDNKHAITVSASAVAKHVAQHGDYELAEGGTCGTHEAVVPNNNLSAAMEVCSGFSPTGRRIDVTGLGTVQTTSVDCGS